MMFMVVVCPRRACLTLNWGPMFQFRHACFCVILQWVTLGVFIETFFQVFGFLGCENQKVSNYSSVRFPVRPVNFFLSLLDRK